MKKFGIVFLCFFLLLTFVYAFFQGSFGQNLVKNSIAKALKASGYEVEIKRIDGALPSSVQLKGVTIEENGVKKIYIEKLLLRLSIWRLLKKELYFRDVLAKNIELDDIPPFDFSGEVSFSERKAWLRGTLFDTWVECSYYRNKNDLSLRIKNALVTLKGRAKFNETYELLHANLQIGSSTIFSYLPDEPKGKLLSSMHIKQNKGVYEGLFFWKILNIEVEKQKLPPIEGKGMFSYADEKFQGEIKAKNFAQASFSGSFQNGLRGKAMLKIDNLHSLSFFPELFGKTSADIDVEEKTVRFSAKGSQINYRNLFIKDLEGKGSFSPNEKGFSLEAKEIVYDELNTKQLALSAKNQGDAWDFDLRGEGEYLKPFGLQAKVRYEESGKLLLSHLKGDYAREPFSLLSPSQFTWGKNSFSLPKLFLLLGDGEATVSLQKSGEEKSISIDIQKAPLSFIPTLSLESGREGTFSLKGALKEKKGRTTGSFSADLLQLTPFSSQGEGKIVFEKDFFSLDTTLTKEGEKFSSAHLKLPGKITLFPFTLTFDPYEEVGGRLFYSGRIEKILDFFDLKSHVVQGDLNLDLSFSNTWKKAFAKGSIHLQNASYENYYTGTSLQGIDALFEAKKDALYLKSLTTSNDSLQATGKLLLDPYDRFPFSFDLSFQELPLAQIDLIDTSGTGKVHIEGNSLAASVKGKVFIEKATLTIPEHVPTSLPDLEVSYRNQIKPVQKVQNPSFFPYSLFLDVEVTAPNIVVEGRGLKSSWEGKFTLGGSYSDLVAKGKIDLSKGEFSFASKHFKLQEGSLVFSGKEGIMPQIHLEAMTETKGITIIASLQGSLNNPSLTLHSSPPLPLSSILSYLLFGKDASEIGGFEALQIVASLTNFKSSGPGILEETKKSLGIDRLRLVTDDSEEGRTSLEVGKYVADGILVSFTQGAEEDSTNISVEIELKHHFVFQIESDQRQEQGKFTLKWSLNY